MSAGVETGSRGRGADSQDFELNIASIIDCFTVLIAFMLVSASFLSIGIMDAGVAAAGNESASATPPPINVTVEIAGDRKISVKVTGKTSENHSFPAIQGKSDYDRMTQSLGSLKSRWKDLNAVTLTADAAVEYRDVVRAMEVLRQSVPVVLLGGF